MTFKPNNKSLCVRCGLTGCYVADTGRACPTPANDNIPENNREALRTRPRKTDRRLWEGMNAEETRAAQLIYYGFQFRTTGLGFRTSLYEAMPRGSAPNDDWQADVIRQFLAWATACQAEGLSVAAALDIIVFGRSCRETDKARRKRKGYARDTLKACLEIYVNLRKTP